MRKPTLTATILGLCLALPAVAQDEQAGATADPGAAGASAGMPSAEMMQRMRDMHQQRMQPRGAGMPMMGPRGGMMSPEMRQQMQEMQRQRMEMMQSRAAMTPAMPSDAGGAESSGMPPMGMGRMQGMSGKGMSGQGMSGKGMRGCGHKPGAMREQMQAMKKERMARKEQHWQAMEERMSNIENLLRELVELRKGN